MAVLGETHIEDYADIIDKLGERGIIPSEFAEKIRGMAGLRNILAHEYAELDLKKVYDILQNRLIDFYCGHTENADLNASINILAEGHSVIACGVETLVSTVKQELQPDRVVCDQTRKPVTV